ERLTHPVTSTLSARHSVIAPAEHEPSGVPRCARKQDPRMTPPAAAVVFDMDGVLVDTEPISRGVLAEIYQDYGHEISSGHLDAIVGVQIDEAINMLSAAHPVAVGNAVIRSEYEQIYLPRLD